MKNLKLTALLLCAAMTIPCAVGCQKHSSSSSNTKTSSNSGEPVTISNDKDLGKNKITASIAQEAAANETTFKLNSVVQTENVKRNNNPEKKYIYLNVEIKNDSDTDYNLSSLNNVWLRTGENTVKTCDIVTRFYASEHFKDDKFILDPFVVPAHSTVSGYITGYEVDPSLDKFTVEFFPTQNDIHNKNTVIQVEVTPDMIKSIPAEDLK